MKTTLRLIIISMTLLISLQSFSQTIIDEGKNWSIKEGYYPPSGGYTFGTKSYRIEGDTIINLIHYKKIKSTYDTIWTSYDSPNGFIRMDSTKKVYFNDGIEHLLYDFNLQVGDTFVGNSFWANHLYTLVVDSVDSVTLENGVKNKRILFGDNLSGYPTEYWIESVGSNFGLISTGFYLVMYDFDYELLCCKKNNESLFMNQSYATCFVTSTGIDNPEPNIIRIFPNVSYDEFNVKGMYITSIELLNINGQVVLKKDINSNDFFINIKNEPNGMYFLKVQSEKGQMSINKIIKQ
jgi:hypothetical protein